MRKSTAKAALLQSDQQGLDSAYRRRTYTNVSLPGVLGLEFWKEHPLDEEDSRPAYKMTRLLVFVLPSPPRFEFLREYLDAT